MQSRIDAEERAELVLRPLAPGDERLIFNSWLKSYRDSAGGVSHAVYFAQHHRLIERLLRRCAVVVAANAEDTTQILGYVVCEAVAGIAVVHYVYVKAPFRNLGVATALLKAATAGAQGVHHSHATAASGQLVKRFRSIFNPYLSH